MNVEKRWESGQALEPLVKRPITKEDLRFYAEASEDGNLIHLDDEYAKKAGFPSVIVHGMLSMAFLADHLRFNFPEGQFRLKRMRVRFRRVTFPGDVLTCEGEIAKVLAPNAW